MSSDSDVMISVRGLSKSYTIAHNQTRASTLGEAVVQRLRRPTGRVEQETFWALKDVNFDVHRGDVVGVIGRNGAGKSTLFKVLSRITEPTAGQVDLYGRVGSLLEVGTGFSGDLTGRENIFLNGTILGMRRAEIAKRFDEIVDFAGVDQFLDTPVKRYSSGMYVRLAFAVAAHLDPEILIVDEVLSVGDAEFQKKCLGRIKEVAQGGRTVMFVSHNISSVRQLCNKALVLARGVGVYAGPVEAGIDAYTNLLASGPKSALMEPGRRPGSGEWRFTAIGTAKEQFDPTEPKSILFRAERQHGTARGQFFVVVIRDAEDSVVARCDSRLVGCRIDSANAVDCAMSLSTPWLRPGTYSIDAYIDTGAGFCDVAMDAWRFDVGELLPYSETAPADATSNVPVLSDFQFEIAN